MKAYARLAFGLVAAFVLTVLCAGGLFLSANHRNRQRAESLLNDIRSFKAGDTTQADIERLVQRHDGEKQRYGYASACPSADVFYGVRILNEPLIKVEVAHPWLHTFGARPWWVSATFFLKEGRLCYLAYTVSEWPHNNENTELSARAVLAPSADELSVVIGDKENHRYGISNRLIRNSSHSLEVTLAPNATDTERNHAFGFDLSCLTSLRGCEQVCQFVPLVWSDYLRRLTTEGQVITHQEECNPSRPSLTR
jgi:hypothetical protein